MLLASDAQGRLPIREQGRSDVVNMVDLNGTEQQQHREGTRQGTRRGEHAAAKPTHPKTNPLPIPRLVEVHFAIQIQSRPCASGPWAAPCGTMSRCIN